MGGGIELCGSYSCMGGLRSLLNTEGIQTFPMFLLSNKIFDMNMKCFICSMVYGVALSIIVKSLSSAFGCFLEVVVSDSTVSLISMV